MQKIRKGGLVSVVLPAFNASRHIRECLESVLSQTYSFIEIIVVDDGSTDETSRIVLDFAARDARVRLIRQNNEGVGAARNVAIRAAVGRYVAPIDADDVWFPEKLEMQVARIEELGPNTGMVYCWSRRINSHGRITGYGRPHTVEGSALRAMLLRNILGNASVPLFRASALQIVGLYLSRAEQHGGQGFEDWDLSLRIAEQFEIGVVPRFLVDYRQRAEAISTNAVAMSASFECVMQAVQVRNPHIPAREFRWSRGHFYYYMTRRSFVWNRFRPCVDCLTKAVLADPLLLLNLQTYRMLSRITLEILRPEGFLLTDEHGSRIRHLNRNAGAKRRQPSGPPVGQRIYCRVQLKRWSGVLSKIDTSVG